MAYNKKANQKKYILKLKFRILIAEKNGNQNQIKARKHRLERLKL